MGNESKGSSLVDDRAWLTPVRNWPGTPSILGCSISAGVVLTVCSSVVSTSMGLEGDPDCFVDGFLLAAIIGSCLRLVCWCFFSILVLRRSFQ